MDDSRSSIRFEVGYFPQAKHPAEASDKPFAERGLEGASHSFGGAREMSMESAALGGAGHSSCSPSCADGARKVLFCVPQTMPCVGIFRIDRLGGDSESIDWLACWGLIFTRAAG